MILDGVSHALRQWAMSPIESPKTDWKLDYTYFAVDESGLIKIGRSWNPSARMKQVARTRGCAVRLIAVVKWGRNEKPLHRRFSDDALGGEWFVPSLRLLSLIATIKQTGAL